MRRFGLLLLIHSLTYAQQPCVHEVVAGVPPSETGDGGPAISAFLFEPHGTAADAAGNIYIADMRNHRIRRVAPNGTISTVAGNGRQGSGGDDGPAADASLSRPEAVFATPDGSLYIADTGNHRVRKVSAQGVISAVAGTGHPGFDGDRGSALAAELRAPGGIAVDSTGNLFIADSENNRIRRVDRAGIITTVAGSRNPANRSSDCCFDGDGGPATDAHLLLPKGVVVAPDGAFYIADTGNVLVRRVGPDGIIRTVAGSTSRFPGLVKYPAPALTDLQSAPSSLALLPDGSLLIPALNLLRLTPDGQTLEAYSSDFASYAMADSEGRVYLTAPDSSHRVARVDRAGAASQPWAGQERFGRNVTTSPALGASLRRPTGVTVAPDNLIYLGDYLDGRVVRIRNGAVEKVASAQGPTGVAVDAAGNVYYGDYGLRAVRRVDPTGVVTTIAGGFGSLPLAGSAPVLATSVEIRPVGLAVHPNGSLYIAAFRSPSSPTPMSIYRLTPDGRLSHFYTSPLITRFRGLAIEASGNLLVPNDQANILRFNPEGTFIDDIGGRERGFPDQIVSIAAGSSGEVYVADSLGRVKVRLADGSFSTIYNRDLDQYLGAENFSDSALVGVASLAAGRDGELLVTQRDLHRLLRFRPNACTPPPQPLIAAIRPVAAGPIAYAPGDFASFYGEGLGPAAGAGPVVDADSRLPRSLAGVRVLFDGEPGPVQYAATAQVNALLPFSMYGRDQVRAQVEFEGVLSDATFIPVQETAPKFFATVPSGSTPVPIVVNPDGSLNSSSNPAPTGSVVILYASGFGRTTPEGVDGKVAAAPLSRPVAPVTVAAPFTVLYAGSAAGMVEGITQINVQLPPQPVSMSVRLTCGDFSTEFYVRSQ